MAIEPRYAAVLGIDFRSSMVKIPAGLCYVYPAVISARKERTLEGGQEDGTGEAGYKEGVYTAQAKGNNGDVKVEVEFSPDAIVKVTVTDHQETPGLSAPAIEKIPQRIVDGQTLNVDAVSGATNTSNAILEAVADCVTQAGGEAEGLKAKEAQANTAVEEMDADVVVVGGGASGSGAALAAAGVAAKKADGTTRKPWRRPWPQEWLTRQIPLRNWRRHWGWII